MKKLILILIATIVVAACKKEVVEDPDAGLDQRLVGEWTIDGIHINGMYSYWDSLGNTPITNYQGVLDSTLRDFRAEWVQGGDYDTMVTFTSNKGTHICDKYMWDITGSPWLGSMYHYTLNDNIYLGCDVYWNIQLSTATNLILYNPTQGRTFYLSKN